MSKYEDKKKLSAEFIASETRYRRLFEAARDGILILDAETGMIVDVNPFLIELLGYSHEMFLGKAIWNIGFFKDIFANKEKFLELQQNEYIRYEDLPLETYTGRKINVEFISNVYLADHKKIIQCNIRDITERKKAEEKIKNSEVLLQRIIDLLPVRIFWKDKDLKFLGCNKVFAEDAGKESSKDLIGKDDFQMNWKEQADLYQEDDKEVINSGVSKLNFEELQTTPNEGKIWLNTNKVPLTNMQGNTIGILGSYENITKRKQAEEKTQLLAHTIKSITEIVTITDLENRFIFVNQAFCDIYGYSSEEIIGQNIKMLLSQNNPPDILKEILKKSLKDNWKGELLNITKDGREFPISLQTSKILNEKGEIVGLVGISEDITVRKQAEEALIKSEQEFHSLAESMPQIVWITRPDGWNIYFNQQWIDYTGLTLEESYGHGWNKPFHPDDQQSSWDAWQNAVKNNGEYSVECRLRRHDGVYHWWLIRGMPQISVEGKILKWFGTCTDIDDIKRSEEKISISEERFKQVSENANEWIWEMDKNGLYTYASPIVKVILGYEAEELVNKKYFYDLLLPDVKEKMMILAFDMFSRKEKFKDLVNINKHKDGREIILSSCGVPILDKEGNLSGYRGVDIDITEKKLMERRLSFFALILEHLNRKNEWQNLIRDILKEIKSYTGIDAVGIRLNDKEDYPYFTQSGFAENFIKEENFLCAKKNDGSALLNQEGFPVLECTCGVVLSGKADSSKPYFTEEGSFWTNQSSDLLGLLPNEDPRTNPRNNCIHSGYMSVALVPIRSGEKIIGLLQLNDKKPGRFTIDFIKFFEDVASAIGIAYRRMRSEEDIKISEVKYRELVDNALIGVYKISFDGNIIFCNETMMRILEYDGDDYTRINAKQFYKNPADREELIRIVTEKGEIRNFETELITYKGKTINVIINNKLEGNNLTGMMMDITEQKQAEIEIIFAKEKAEEISRLKTNFLANMSHEIRTPLNGILGFTEILKNELENPVHKNFANIIEKSGYRLLETLDLILSFSKLEAEKEDIHYSNVHIEDVLDEVIKSFEATAKKKNLFLIKEVKKEKVITNIDERFFRQIMNNLINNAIKYTETGGVTVSLSKDNGNVIINVKDTGIGIAKDKHKIIFEEFRQESEGHGRNFEGTGLGLAITKRFVELMSGTIEVDSEPEVGSTFTVKFPDEKSQRDISIKLKKEDVNKEIIIPEPEEVKKFSILLVEDDEVTRDFTSEVLKKYYKIEFAFDGLTAIEKANSKVYDIILMDINLGKGIDGIETVKNIRKIPDYFNTPIIALTAFVLPGDREEFIAAGCTHYLGKPYARNRILELLKNITGNLN